MSLRKMTVQYIGDTLYLPPLEREVKHIIVREDDVKDWAKFEPVTHCKEREEMSDQAEQFYSEMYTLSDKRISWGEYICRLYDTDEIELLTEREIVRCRDCRHFTAGDREYATCDWCDWWDSDTEADGFCAWGRKEGSMTETYQVGEFEVTFTPWHSEYLDEDFTAVAVWRGDRECFHSGMTKLPPTEEQAREVVETMLMLQRGIAEGW